jgi:agmatine deiminase
VQEAGAGSSSGLRKRDLEILKLSKDALGRGMNLRKILPPREKFLKLKGSLSAPCYVNAYIANGAVIAPVFGDPERDELAKEAFTQLFPMRNVKMVRIDHIISGGGGIRCLTQPMPAYEGLANDICE